MKNTKRAMEFDIYCDFDLNTRAQRFAGKHVADRTVIEVRSKRRWFKTDPRVIVTFKTEASRTDIYRSFVEDFKDYSMEIIGRELYIRNKEESQ